MQTYHHSTWKRIYCNQPTKWWCSEWQLFIYLCSSSFFLFSVKLAICTPVNSVNFKRITWTQLYCISPSIMNFLKLFSIVRGIYLCPWAAHNKCKNSDRTITSQSPSINFVTSKLSKQEDDNSFSHGVTLSIHWQPTTTLFESTLISLQTPHSSVSEGIHSYTIKRLGCEPKRGTQGDSAWITLSALRMFVIRIRLLKRPRWEKFESEPLRLIRMFSQTHALTPTAPFDFIKPRPPH